MTIIVNGEPKQIDDINTITYERIVKLSDLPYSEYYSIVYYDGDPIDPQGILTPGSIVFIADNMRFSVHDTGAA